MTKKRSRNDEVRLVWMNGQLTKARLVDFTSAAMGFTKEDNITAWYFPSHDPDEPGTLLLSRWEDLDDLVVRLGRMS